MYALDLNPSILTEDAEFVFFGPYMQYMSGVTDTQVKWILENRSDNPQIREGDMFLANDPWVGAAHQMDVMLICPVFWEGELVAFVANVAHMSEVGAKTPGGLSGDATEIYQEGLRIPPLKLYDRGTRNDTLHALIERNVRVPRQVLGDVRAQLAACAAGEKGLLCRVHGMVVVHLSPTSPFSRARIMRPREGVEVGWPADQVERSPIDLLIPYAKNVNRHGIRTPFRG